MILTTLDEDMLLMSNITGGLLFPKGNNNLLIKDKDNFNLDDFKHEQCLVLRDGGENILISGCYHTGILNVLKHVEETIKVKIGIVIGGLHLYNPINKRNESSSFINELGNELLDKILKFTHVIVLVEKHLVY